MTDNDRIVADLLAAAGGEMIGRVRLQKVFYLLQELGLNAKLPFRYHHYGPYSRALDEAIERAKAFRGVREETEYRKSDGLPYSVFKSAEREVSAVGGIDGERARQLIRTLKAQPSTVLELAATAHWLRTVEQVADWRRELVKRKGAKTDNGRIETALALLARLGLWAPEAAAPELAPL